jgi:6-phosphogluconolactonase (cycloisomerase 2 family)
MKIKKNIIYILLLSIACSFIFISISTIPEVSGEDTFDPQGAPTVVTNASTGVEETNATINTYISNDGGGCSVGMEYGTDTSYGAADMDFITLDTIDNGGTYYDAYSDGTYIYTACDTSGIRAYSFNGTDFTLLDTQDDGGNYRNLWGDGTYIHAACRDDGLRAYTFNGTAFTLVDTIDNGTCWDVCSDGTYIYTAMKDSGLTAYSFDGNAYTWLDTHFTGSQDYIACDSDGTYIYVASYTVGRAYSFDGNDLTHLDTCDDAVQYYWDISTDGTYIYTAMSADGIFAYSFDGNDYTLEDTIDPGSTTGVWADDTFVHAGVGDMFTYSFDGSSFKYLDFESPQTYEGCKDGDYLYTAIGGGGLRAYRIGYSTGYESSMEITGLSEGQLYHCRAIGINSDGISYGSDTAFLTKPLTPTSLTVSAYNSTQINLTWSQGTGANLTYIERDTSSNWALGEGTEIYNSSGTSYEDSGLNAGNTYYYQAWSYTNWTYNPTLHQYSDDNDSGSNTTGSGPPTVITNDSTGVEETNATLHGYISADGGADCTVKFEYGTDTTYGNTLTYLLNLLDTQDNGNDYKDVWGDGTYVFTACYSSGVRAYSFDGTDFTLLDTDTPSGLTYGVYSDGTYVYGARYSNGIDAYTFDGNTLVLKDTHHGGSGTYYDIWGDGTYVYAAVQGIGIYAYTFDGTDLTNVGHSTHGTNGVWGDGTYIYSACQSSGIRAYTFNGTDFTLLDTLDNGGVYYDVWGDGTYIYAACYLNGVRAYSFDGADFTHLDSVDDGGHYYDVWADGTYVYTSCGSNGIRAYSFNGADFTLVDHLDDGGTYYGIHSDGNYIYTGCTADGVRAYETVAFSTNDEFNKELTGLSAGQLYRYRAVADNGYGTSNGSDKAFLTKPLVPTSVTATAVNSTHINVSWTSGTGANLTYVERNASGVTSWARGTGTEIYNGSGLFVVDSGLNAGTTYYYQAWSYTNWTYNPTLHQWSDDNDSDNAQTEQELTLNISISPSSIDFGTVNVSDSAKTTGYYFNLTNNGLTCNVDMSVGDSQNWTLVNYTDRGHDKFCVNWSNDNWSSNDTNIPTDGATLVSNLATNDWFLFDIKAILPTSISHVGNGEKFNLSLTATVV